MRKTAALILAAAMMVVSAFPAFAENPTSKSTEIKYTPAAESYLVTIDPTVSITAADTDYDLKATVSDAKILKSNRVKVEVKSANGWKLKNSTSLIDYTAAVDSTTLTGEGNNLVFAVNGVGTQTATSGTKTIKIKSTAAQINEATIAGEHKDTLTFTIGIEAKPE